MIQNYFQYQKNQMKSLTIKQAQKWLQKIKQENPTAYRDLGKCLRRYDKTNDQYECFIKMNEALYPIPILFTEEINEYMDLGNKFAINYPFKQRINSFLGIVKATKQQLFRDIVQYVNSLVANGHNYADSQNDELERIIKTGILEIVKNHSNLVEQAHKMFDLNQELAIKRLDLTHLKNKGTVPYQEEEEEEQEVEKPLPIKKVKKYPPVYFKQVQVVEKVVREPTRPKANLYSFLTSSQEKSFVKQLEKKIGANAYKQVIKILFLYYSNIISQYEFIELVKNVIGADIEGLADVTQTRQISRRRNSLFKPLSDIDFHILPRETHSYVQMPATYPHYAKNRTKEHLQILNNKWVSVPRGTEQFFNVRIKNVYEMALNKCEDQRYEFDVVIRKFRKTKQILEKIYEELNTDQNANVDAEANLIISLGALQILYRNTSKEQKDIFEEARENNLFGLIQVWLSRVRKMLEELQETKKLYATKIWTEAAHKNFHKSLDFKNHQFKRCQKIKMRPQAFLDEISQRVQYLQSRENKRINSNPFEDKKQFFSILNSFETTSRKERCQHRKLPTPKTYNIKSYPLPTLLPATILAFEDTQVMEMVCNFVLFYNEFAVSNEMEKVRCRSIFKQIMRQFFGIKNFFLRCLSNVFDQQKFFNEEILNPGSKTKISDWVIVYQKDYQSQNLTGNHQKIPILNSFQESPSQYSFQPPKADNNLVLYATENFYVFLRFLYTLYERLIRIKEVAQSERKVQLFQILYYACIKAKQNVRFQDNLSVLFGEYSYLFTTIYKVVEGVCKAVNTISLSPIENYSFSLISMKNQEIYLFLLNHFMLSFSSNTTRLMRFTHQFDTHLLYINSFNPYYKFNEQNLKQYNKKRLQISKNVQIYNLDPQQRIQAENIIQSTTQNNQQYYFESNSYKLLNIANFQDIIVGQKKHQNIQMKKEMDKLKNFHTNFKIL